MEKLKILLPKGRIYENVTKLFSDAGIDIYLPERAYRPTVNQDDLEAKVMKPQNIGKLLELGAHDVGFTGIDWIRETSADVVEIMDLGFDKVRIVAAVPNDLDDAALRSKRVIVATEYVNNAEAWLKTQNMKYLTVRTYGATEVFPPDDADMIIDNTATGRTLIENGLRIVDTIMESSTRMFASKEAMADPAKSKKIQELKMLFESVLAAKNRVMLEMNVSKARFSDLVSGIPAMKSPTVAPLYGDDGYAIKIVVKKSEAPTLLPKLKSLGATDILEYELRKVMP
ncbi:ATP phosphoribosyltransferase [Treponema zuelzerae]|jgi:ATP phosphoribosyltransferase|uniref:ATP phosphoribosyltransferase n=1 Tax=Teretinema zuelzerae TaxID=156 RepID=A0AAE3EJG8_9SPIR|nr:ATP phosphoribosyltransferase [Teretinema zuelzerae]MBN2810600.1 ATP phosphoribosyltransferase [Spirochaetales bacterium]MCD1655832.1 ATP phosphoribosyltransferase [Teretinema zuelzerae]